MCEKLGLVADELMVGAVVVVVRQRHTSERLSAIAAPQPLLQLPGPSIGALFLLPSSSAFSKQCACKRWDAEFAAACAEQLRASSTLNIVDRGHHSTHTTPSSAVGVPPNSAADPRQHFENKKKR